MTQSSVLGAIPSGSGLSVRLSLNECFQALSTENSGTSAPAPTYPFMYFRNTTTKVLWARNSTNTAWEIRINYGATTAPTINDDSGDGYITGSWWFDITNHKVYSCFDSAVGAAVWQDLSAGSGGPGTIADNSITNAKLVNVSTATFKARATGGTGSPEDITTAQARTLLNVETGATAAGAAGDAFASSHPGSTGSAHGNATASVAGFMPAADKSKLDAATSSAAPSTLVMRDSAGRLAIAAPSAAGDATTKGYVDALAFPDPGGVFALDGDNVPGLADNVNNNVTNTHHGWTPKLSGNSNTYLNGAGAYTVPPGGSGSSIGTTIGLFTDDATFGDNDDVGEVYLGKRVTLPSYDAGKRDRIMIVNAGNSASVVRAYASASVVKGFKVTDISASSATRFVSSVNAPSIGSKLTISFWIREDTHTNNRGILHFANGVEESTGSYFRLSSTYVSGGFLQIENRNASVTSVLRRYPITQGVTHHVLISIDLTAPLITVVVDGVVVPYDTTQSGNLLSSAQPIGGSSQPIRLGTKITALYEEIAGSIGQFAVWANCWPTIDETAIRKFYNDGPVIISNSTAVNGTVPFICLNSGFTGSPAAMTNTGSLGGAFIDSYGSGVSQLDVGGADSPMLEQIDGYPHPTGYILPVGQMVTLIRRSTEGIWGIF